MNLEYWHWLALGFVLMSIELILPSFFFMWLGMSALAVGVLFFAIPDLSFEIQGALFAIAGAFSFFASRKFFRGKQKEMGKNNLNKRMDSFVGQIVVLESAIENGRGKARIGDTLWSVEGPDLPAGSRVKIVQTEGMQLHVEQIN